MFREKTRTEGAVQLTNPKAVQIPSTFIYCNTPAMGPFGQFAEKLKKDKSWRYVELAAGQDSMITAPENVATLLLQLVVPTSNEGPTPSDGQKRR